ncbi:MAG: hypothetical protein LBC20_05350, partial [Planctomycetaceae bacterium]|nr:hypothetical protein [Planctomycetaceae bacterium]
MRYSGIRRVWTLALTYPIAYSLPSNSGCQRVNINGAVNIDTLEVEVDFTDSINSESMKRLMDQLIQKNPKAKTIYV